MAATVQPEASYREALEAQNFWNENYSRLVQDFPEEFVAIRLETGEVVAHNPDLAMLVYDLRDRGIDSRSDVAIQYISSRSGSLLL